MILLSEQILNSLALVFCSLLHWVPLLFVTEQPIERTATARQAHGGRKKQLWGRARFRSASASGKLTARGAHQHRGIVISRSSSIRVSLSIMSERKIPLQFTRIFQRECICFVAAKRQKGVSTLRQRQQQQQCGMLHGVCGIGNAARWMLHAAEVGRWISGDDNNNNNNNNNCSYNNKRRRWWRRRLWKVLLAGATAVKYAVRHLNFA